MNSKFFAPTLVSIFIPYHIFHKTGPTFLLPQKFQEISAAYKYLSTKEEDEIVFNMVGKSAHVYLDHIFSCVIFPLSTQTAVNIFG